MKKYMPKTKTEFAEMLKRDYGHSHKLATDCAAIIAGHGGFPDEGKTPIERLMIAAQKVCWYDFSDCDDDVVQAVDSLTEALAEAQSSPSSPTPPAGEE